MAELLEMINHEHPLVFNEDTRGPSDNTFHCAGCRKEVSSGPSYSCVGCGLYLHKECAEAPSEVHHPVHDYHPFLLLPLSDYPETEIPCSFCNGKQVGGFLYHCSCEFYLHINCALLPRDSTGNSSEILHYAHQHPLTSIVPKGDFNCHGCLTKLKDASYSCSRCRVFFHKKCLELSTEIKHSCHRKHPLTLVFNGPCYYGSACNLCQSRRWGYFFYRCAPCGFNIHPDCVMSA